MLSFEKRTKGNLDALCEAFQGNSNGFFSESMSLLRITTELR